MFDFLLDLQPQVRFFEAAIYFFFGGNSAVPNFSLVQYSNNLNFIWLKVVHNSCYLPSDCAIVAYNRTELVKFFRV